RFTNVSLYTEALWSEVGSATFYVCADSGQSALWSTVDTRETARVGLMPLDAIAPALAAGVRFMKLDVEGAEQRVLEGATALLENGQPSYIVCEINPIALAQLNCDQDGLRSLMRLCGYEIFLLHENGALPTLVPEATRIKPTKQNTNV